MTKNILIVGGTSGLGLELAKTHLALGFNIFITGIENPNLPQFEFRSFVVGSDSTQLTKDITALVKDLPTIHTLIYTAGFYQEGRIDTLSNDQILQAINLNLSAPALFAQALKKQATKKPLKIILITSSSQYTPRELEPVYTAVKAGLGMLGDSLGLDTEIGKVLVVAPSGMNTPFWKNSGHNTSDYLDPKWVAQQITQLASGEFKYKYAKILRNPPKVEIVETR